MDKMIGFLKGTIIHTEETTVILETGGVGYEIEVPISTLYSLSSREEVVQLYIHTHVREDAITLFGFSTSGERILFRKLVSLSGVGPKLALAILGSLETRELLEAVEHSNIVALTSIPGVGKKTAERLILELKSSLPKLMGQLGATISSSSFETRSTGSDVISALENLGFKYSEAERAIAKVSGGDEMDFEELFRLALKELSA
jgi:Holliday junction DNA helicase RuvA